MTEAITKTANQKNTFSGVKITTELAHSPKGITYKAVRLIEGDIVAIKHFRRALCEKKFIEQLAQNAEAAFFLEHPSLVNYLGCTNENNRLLLISEFAPGEALSRILKQKLPIATSHALDIILRCASGLQYAANKKQHHGRLHPGDILVSEESVRILGVGLGERPEHAAWTTPDPQLFEPLIYTASEALPSQSFPTTEAGLCAVDIYSLGAILVHLLDGVPPFRGTDEGALVAEHQNIRSAGVSPARNAGVSPASDMSLPLSVRDMIEKMMSLETHQRPSFETVILTLTDALKAAKKAERSESDAQIPKSQQPTHFGAPSGIRQVSVPVVPYISSCSDDPADWVRKRHKRASSSYATIALAVLTAVIFTLAMAKTYLYVPSGTITVNTGSTTPVPLTEPLETNATPTQRTAIEIAPTPVSVQPKPIT
ncbi:MAG: protein kinase, partial [Planctomycetota bacterium]